MSLIIGSLIAAAGEAFRIYSAGCIEKNKALTRSGPYRWTRNPLYFGSFLLFFGFSIASGNIVLVVVFIIAFHLVYDSTIALEEKFLREKFGNEFEKFAGEVPRFFPAPRFPRGLGGGFSWSRVGRNHEYEGAAGFIVVICILCAEFFLRFSPYGYLMNLFSK